MRFAPLGLLLLAPVLGAAPSAPPETPARPVTDVYHGTSVEDPFRWLEDWSDPAVRAWSEAQNAHARAYLDSLPGTAALRAQLTAILSAPSISYTHPKFAAGRLFVLKQQPPKQQRFLVVMDDPLRPDAATVVVDPNVRNAKGTTAIDWFEPSPDGRLVAVSISDGGSEAGDLHIFEAATGRELPDVLTRVQNGTGGGSAAWAPDSRSILYTRYPRDHERPPEDRAFYMQLYRHVLGTPASEDTYEIGRDFPKIAEVEVATASNGVALVSMQKGDGGEFQHYLRLLDGQWIQLTQYQDRVVQAELGQPGADGRTPVYFVSRKGAPRGRLLRLNVDPRTGAGAGTELERADVVVPEGEDALVSDFGDDAENLRITGQKIYATYQLGGPSEIRVFALDGRRQASPRQFPIGSVSGLAATGAGDRLLFRDTSYIDASTWFVFDPATGATTRTPLSAPAPVEFADCEVVREWAVSADGTRVPVNIIRRQGLARDGSHPCYLTGYGGFGLNITPAYRAAVRVLLDQGFVFAQANLRGGGEFGETWHTAGNLTRKQTVFDDFAAAARHLIEAGYTRPDRLAIEGGSNGGLLMGATFTQHPELFAAVISRVGIYDMLRVELSSNGAFNIPEYGTVKDEAQFRALYAYSPYHHVRAGVKYPPVLFLTGANDPRVDPMQSRKMTARLQSVGAEAYLRTSASSGHGMGSSLGETIEQTVDMYAFLFAHLGVTYRAEK